MIKNSQWIPERDKNPFTEFKIFVLGPELILKQIQMSLYLLTPTIKPASKDFKSYLRHCTRHFSLPPLLKQIPVTAAQDFPERSTQTSGTYSS